MADFNSVQPVQTRPLIQAVDPETDSSGLGREPATAGARQTQAGSSFGDAIAQAVAHPLRGQPLEVPVAPPQLPRPRPRRDGDERGEHHRRHRTGYLLLDPFSDPTDPESNEGTAIDARV